jgi:hypothetical protein
MENRRSPVNFALAGTRASIVYTLRCTQRLLARLDQPIDGGHAAATSTTALGDWYANTLNVGRLRLLLCTSERTLLTVLLPAKDLGAFPDRLREAVVRMLTRLDVANGEVARERREMAWHQLGRTASRRILGSMNDFAFLAETYIRDEGPDVDLDAIATILNRAPCRPIEYQSPDRLTQAVFRRAS